MRQLCIAIAAISFGVGAASATVQTRSLADGVTTDELAGALVGRGVTVSNVTVRGCASGVGTFAGGADGIGLEAGLALGSGALATVGGPNQYPNVSTACGVPGDADLDALVPVGGGTVDASVIELDFVPAGDTVTFRYVFASEEYPEFVGSYFNDVFGVFVNGANVAHLPGTTVPVTINTVNAAHHPVLYVDNDVATAGAPRDTEADGLTQVLTVTAPVVPGETNRMKLAVADASDPILDSWLFVEAQSLQATSVDVTIAADGSSATVACDAGVDASRRTRCRAAGFVAGRSRGRRAVPAGLRRATNVGRARVDREGRADLRLRPTRAARRLVRQAGALETLVVARVEDRDGAVEVQRLVELRAPGQ